MRHHVAHASDGGGRASAPLTFPSTTTGLPQDLEAEASRRLAWAGLIYAGAFFVAYFGSWWATAGTGLVPASLFEERAVRTTVAILSVALGLAVFLVARYSRLSPRTILDLGLGFEVVGAFGIAASEYWGVHATWDPDVLGQFTGIPWEAVWIILFPFLAPNTPRRILLASLGAAAAGPAVVALSRAAGASDPAAPLSFYAVHFGFTSFLCAGIAYAIARQVYRFGVELKEAREVGSYRLVERLGLGGMGEVWRAEHRMLVRPAAVKLIRPEVLGKIPSSRETVLLRFEKEAQATAELHSCHTIQLYDFGVTEEGAFYYVMELLDGIDLDSLVRRHGPVPAGRTVYLLRQVCHSLGEAHDRGLVHRDVKPANLFTCRVGPDVDFVKVLDFGLVKAVQEERGGEATQLTAESVMAGTPAFMAPEMALRERAVDARTDLYALGCVAYWLLTGVHVFHGDTALATVVKHVQEPPLPPSRRTELEVPPALESIVMACLAKDPEERPRTAWELRDRLAGAVPRDAWDQDRARSWWDLHRPVGAGSRAASPGAALEADGEAERLRPVKA